MAKRGKRTDPQKLAKHLSDTEGLWLELAYADVLYNPGCYYRRYRSVLGGDLSFRDWILLCEEERKPVKDRKSLR